MLGTEKGLCRKSLESGTEKHMLSLWLSLWRSLSRVSPLVCLTCSCSPPHPPMHASCLAAAVRKSFVVLMYSLHSALNRLHGRGNLVPVVISDVVREHTASCQAKCTAMMATAFRATCQLGKPVSFSLAQTNLPSPARTCPGVGLEKRELMGLAFASCYCLFPQSELHPTPPAIIAASVGQDAQQKKRTKTSPSQKSQWLKSGP